MERYLFDFLLQWSSNYVARTKEVREKRESLNIKAMGMLLLIIVLQNIKLSTVYKVLQ
jgi:hypothetical protein